MVARGLWAYYRKILTFESYLTGYVTMTISVRTSFKTKAIDKQHFLSELSIAKGYYRSILTKQKILKTVLTLG